MTDLFLRLVNMSIAASWIVLVVVALRLVLRKAPKWSHCLMWSMVGLRLAMPFRLESVFSLVPQVEVQEFSYPSRSDIQVAPPSAGSPAGAAPSVPNAPTVPSVPNTPTTPITPPSVADPIPADAAGQLPDLITVLAVVWLVGCIVLLAYGIFSYLRLYRRVRASLRLGDDVFICDDISSPFLLGVLRPRIYLPSGIPDEQIPYILAHERAHRKRRDHLWKPLGFVFLAVYWFNPVMWLAYSLFCRDIELACDEKVIRGMDRGDKRAYSQALLSCAAPRRTILISPLAFGEVGIKKRIRSVLSYRRPAFQITFVAVAACVVVGVCFLTDPHQTSHDLLDTPNDHTDPAINPTVGGIAVTAATVSYPELVPEELSDNPFYIQALDQPSAILYNQQAVTGRGPVDAFLQSLKGKGEGELYLYDFRILSDSQEHRLSYAHLLTGGGETQVEEGYLFSWDEPLETRIREVDKISFSDDGYLTYHIDGYSYASQYPVVNARELPVDAQGAAVFYYTHKGWLEDDQIAYLDPLDYTAVTIDWDWPGNPPSNWLWLFESFYYHENGHHVYEDLGDDWPVEEVTATVNRYFDGVTRQMAISSNYRATYNADDDTIHYVDGRGGAPNPLRAIFEDQDYNNGLLTLYYEAYDWETGVPYGPPYALTVELMEDGGFRYRSNHPAELPIPLPGRPGDPLQVRISDPQPAPDVPSGEQLRELDFSAMEREELIELLQPVLDRASYFCEFGLVGELDRLGIDIDHDPHAAIRRNYRIFENHVFYPYKDFPYQSLAELEQDMLTVFTADNLEGPLAYIFENMIDENGKVYVPSGVSGYSIARRWQLENMEIVSAERTQLTITASVSWGPMTETFTAPLNFEIRNGYIVMDNSYFSRDPASL